MCGITGFLGDGPALPVLIGGLKRLEYRGYDSAGLAVANPAHSYDLDISFPPSTSSPRRSPGVQIFKTHRQEESRKG